MSGAAAGGRAEAGDKGRRLRTLGRAGVISRLTGPCRAVAGRTAHSGQPSEASRGLPIAADQSVPARCRSWRTFVRFKFGHGTAHATSNAPATSSECHRRRRRFDFSTSSSSSPSSSWLPPERQCPVSTGNGRTPTGPRAADQGKPSGAERARRVSSGVWR